MTPTFCKMYIISLITFGLTQTIYSEDINQVIQTTGAPLTYLLDTHTSSSNPLATDQIQEKHGWSLVPEDTTHYNFVGDSVFLNDKLAVAVRKNGEGAEAYSLMSGNPKLRMVLIPQGAKSKSQFKLSSPVISENTHGAVQLDATYKNENHSMTVGFRLTTGEGMIEIIPGKGTDQVFCRTISHYAVVPNFFADDMVFSPAKLMGKSLHLPVDQFFVSPIEDGNVMIMYVWETAHSDASMIIQGEGQKPEFIGAEIECQENKKLWIAFLEKPNIWFFHPVGAQIDSFDSQWKPPFPAKWRLNTIQSEGWANSTFLPFQSKERWPDSSHLIYPIDRDVNTPLTVYCPVDIMKNTVGVGPCQYILEAEKLGSDSHPTPEPVTDWIEKQFAKKKEKTVKDEIQDNLEAMINYLQQTRNRIQQYDEIVDQLLTLCSSQIQKPSEISPAVTSMKNTLERIKHCIAEKQEAMQSTESIRQITNRIPKLIGQDNALAECKQLCSQIRTVGAAYDYTLSTCRIGINWLRQQSRMAGELYPQEKDFFENIQKKVDGISKRK